MSTSNLKTDASSNVKPSKSVEKQESPDGKNQSKAAVSIAPPTYEEVKPLLQKHTCLACHSQDKKVIGPAFVDIAKRKYSNEKMAQLIAVPQPKNWPDYATPMAPMPHVPKADVLKIASYINGLR